MTRRHLRRTHLLNFDDPAIRCLIASRGWGTLLPFERIGAAYDFVRNEIAFGYNRDDAISASEVLRDGYGQCNTKATLLMTLLRALAIPCRLHGFTIHKALQRGVVPEIAFRIAPQNILHSWVEVERDGAWVNLEGFILDAPFLSALQTAFEGRTSLCAFGAGTDCLSDPPIAWNGSDTYIQRTGINGDLGRYDDPDAFYAAHAQAFGLVRGFLYRHAIRHWMNARVAGIRRGRVPAIPGGVRAAPQPDAGLRAGAH
ncbi:MULTISPECIES: transglutaminase-like domain-containing protein [Rhodobacterales]|uniref:Transglutaminase superfamily protein n=1 Tax=Pseudoroseicyclus aestuarii TaxID=1795041 RepID=A0A318SRL7_9RHOB|nr:MULTISPECIES: transglutaminase family protein [Rhodobacterales]PYE80605.1 transglutaminase superfamily protein [Pseudoroseicyclus aestuarii]RYH00712.1 transglutaminase family protein [Salipiger sp. IMCC34102]